MSRGMGRNLSKIRGTEKVEVFLKPPVKRAKMKQKIFTSVHVEGPSPASLEEHLGSVDVAVISGRRPVQVEALFWQADAPGRLENDSAALRLAELEEEGGAVIA